LDTNIKETVQVTLLLVKVLKVLTKVIRGFVLYWGKTLLLQKDKCKVNEAKLFMSKVLSQWIFPLTDYSPTQNLF
jgi:hypothetical protein